MALTIKVACFFPLLCGLTLMGINFLLWGTESTGGVPLHALLLPLRHLVHHLRPAHRGGSQPRNEGHAFQYPVRTNQIPRQIPEQRYPVWLLLLSGRHPALRDAVHRALLHHVQHVDAARLLRLRLPLHRAHPTRHRVRRGGASSSPTSSSRSRTTAGGGALSLREEPLRFYALLYCVMYLFVDLHRMSGWLSGIIFMSYSLLMSIAILLATGTVGFFAIGLLRVLPLSSVKLD